MSPQDEHTRTFNSQHAVSPQDEHTRTFNSQPAQCHLSTDINVLLTVN